MTAQELLDKIIETIQGGQSFFSREDLVAYLNRLKKELE